MSADETLRRRSEEIVTEFYRYEDQKRYDAFEALAQRADDPEDSLTWEAVFAMQRHLGPLALADVVERPDV